MLPQAMASSKSSVIPIDRCTTDTLSSFFLLMSTKRLHISEKNLKFSPGKWEIGGIAISFIFHPWDYGNGVWDIPALLALASVVLLGTIMSFFCYLEGIRLIGSTRASLYACVEPLAATLIGIFWLHIRFDLIDWVGSAFIVSTVFILSIKTEDKKKQKGQREEPLPSSGEACEE